MFAKANLLSSLKCLYPVVTFLETYDHCYEMVQLYWIHTVWFPFTHTTVNLPLSCTEIARKIQYSCHNRFSGVTTTRYRRRGKRIVPCKHSSYPTQLIEYLTQNDASILLPRELMIQSILFPSMLWFTAHSPSGGSFSPNCLLMKFITERRQVFTDLSVG